MPVNDFTWYHDMIFDLTNGAKAQDTQFLRITSQQASH